MEEGAGAGTQSCADQKRLRIRGQVAGEDLVFVLVGLGRQEDRGREIGHGLKDDGLAVGPEVALAGTEEAEGHLADILEVLGLEPGDLLGGKRAFGREGWAARTAVKIKVEETRDKDIGVTPSEVR